MFFQNAYQTRNSLGVWKDQSQLKGEDLCQKSGGFERGHPISTNGRQLTKHGFFRFHFHF